MQPGSPHRGAGASSCPAARARLTAAAPSQPQAAGGAAAATKFPGGRALPAPKPPPPPHPLPALPPAPLTRGGRIQRGCAAASPPGLRGGCSAPAPLRLRTSSSVPSLPLPPLQSRVALPRLLSLPPLFPCCPRPPPPSADPRRALTLFQLRRRALLSRGMGKETSLQLAAGVLSIFWRRLQLEQGAEGPGRSLPLLVSPCATVPLAINKRARSEMCLRRKKCKMRLG